MPGLFWDTSDLLSYSDQAAIATTTVDIGDSHLNDSDFEQFSSVSDEERIRGPIRELRTSTTLG